MKIISTFIVSIFALYTAAQPPAYTPRNFFIAEISDNRKIKDQHFQSVREVLGDISKNSSLIPIRINLLEMKLSATETPAGERGHCEMMIGFESLAQGLPVELGQQSVAAQHTSPNKGQSQSGAIRVSLKKSLEELDDWMDNNKNAFIATKGVRVRVNRLVKSREGSDTIYYSPDIKLKWPDFLAAPKSSSPAAAATFSGIAYDSEVSMQGGYLTIDMDVEIYFLRSRSWVKPNATNAYILDHEQLHFDITALCALEFLRDVRNATLNQDNYNITILTLFRKANQRSLELQDSYDAETNHSINKEAQERWTKKIRDELKTFN